MINIKFFKNNDKIVKFEASGHAGYDVSGKDIICSAVSSLTQTAYLGITKIIKVKVKLEKDDRKGRLMLELPKELSEKQSEQCQIILLTMLEGLRDIAFGNEKYLKLEE